MKKLKRQKLCFVFGDAKSQISIHAYTATEAKHRLTVSDPFYRTWKLYKTRKRCVMAGGLGS
jgi:hypothetical protein